MDNTIKKIIGCVVTIGLIMLGINKLNVLLRPTNTDTMFSRIYAFDDLPENSIEVMIYGSSHAMKGIKAMDMYEQYGIGAFNYGTNWEHINTTKLFILDSFKSQTPKLAVIETYLAAAVLEDVDMNGEIFYTTYMGHSEERTSFLKQCFGNDLERWLSYYMPLSAFHENWVNLDKSSFQPVDRNSKADSIKKVINNMGFSPSNQVTKIDMPKTNVKQKKLGKSALSELDDIVEICKEKGSQILFVTVPYQKGFAYSDAMRAYAEKNGADYLNLFDYLDEIDIDPKTDFKDSGHLNTAGATKVTAFLSSYINQHYDLTDMREIEGNLWEQ